MTFELTIPAWMSDYIDDAAALRLFGAERPDVIRTFISRQIEGLIASQHLNLRKPKK